jgi:hypothetical protein
MAAHVERLSGRGHHEDVLSELLTELNVLLMLVPRFLTIVTQATTMRASITAYSTAVGPSSLTRKRRTLAIILFILDSFVSAG